MASKVTDMLMSKKGGKTSPMEVSVYVPHRDEPSMEFDDTKWLKKDIQREKDKLASYNKILKNWVPEDVAAKAKADLERKKAECELSLKELKGRLKLRSKKEGK